MKTVLILIFIVSPAITLISWGLYWCCENLYDIHPLLKAFLITTGIVLWFAGITYAIARAAYYQVHKK